MTALYVCNIAAFFLIALLAPVALTRRFGLGALNLLTIPVACLLPVNALTTLSGPALFLEDGCFNPYFQYALLVSNVHDLLAALVTVVVVVRLVRHPALRRAGERLAAGASAARPGRMRLAGAAFLALFLLSFVLLAQHSFSVAQWIASPRTGYQLHRTGAGQWFALCISCLSVSLVLATAYARSTHAILFLAPAYLLLCYLLGSKGIVIQFSIYVVVIFVVRRYRHFGAVAALVLVGATAGTAATFIGGSASGQVDFQSIADYSDYYVNAAHYYQSYLGGSLPLFHGQVFLSSFWAVVPRFLYPDKPYVYGVINVVDVFYPGAAENTNTPAFATIDYFADFGWLGVVTSGLLGLSTLFRAVLYAVVLPRLREFDPHAAPGGARSRLLAYAFLLLVAPDFLMLMDFPVNFIMCAFVVLVIEVANRLRYVGPPQAAPQGAPG